MHPVTTVHYLVLSAALFVPLDLLLGRLNLYRFTWHPTLVRVAAFLVVWAAVTKLWPG